MRRLLIVWITFALVLAQGLRLCLHGYEEASSRLQTLSASTSAVHLESPLSAQVHTEVVRELATPFVIGHDESLVMPAVVILVLALVLLGAPARTLRIPPLCVPDRSRYRYYLFPPGRAPPR